MDILIAFVLGIIVGAVVVYFVAKNNQRKFNEALNIDPKARWKEAIEEVKRKINR